MKEANDMEELIMENKFDGWLVMSNNDWLYEKQIEAEKTEYEGFFEYEQILEDEWKRQINLQIEIRVDDYEEIKSTDEIALIYGNVEIVRGVKQFSGSIVKIIYKDIENKELLVRKLHAILKHQGWFLDNNEVIKIKLYGGKIIKEMKK